MGCQHRAGRVPGIAKTKGSDPVVAFEKFVEDVRAALAKRVISPLLDRMEGFFARTENKPIESRRELEDQLSARLSSGIEGASGSAFSKLLVEEHPSHSKTSCVTSWK